MLVSVCLGTNDLEKATQFYDAVLPTIGMMRLVTEADEVGYGGVGGEVQLWILKPFDKKRATFGNGTQVIFAASSKDDVHKFFDKALENGGADEGAPGPRNYTPSYYGTYVRDLDGNKLHVYIDN